MILLRPLTAFLLILGTLAATTATADEAVLRSGDKIRLQIKGVPDDEKNELDGDYTVSEAGTIPLPYIDDPTAVGVKASVLARRIQAAYVAAQIYTAPTIVINFADVRTVRRISVAGGVARSGPVEFYDGITLLDAITAAGGLSDFAKIKDVSVIRDGKTASIDLSRVLEDSRFDPPLKPGDKVIIPESGKKF